MTSSSYDVVIAGGGVNGCATACFLGLSDDFDGTVLVVERDPTYENAPSARATGGFRQHFSTPENILVGLFGAHFVKHIGDYLAVDGEVPDVTFHERGYLQLGTPGMMKVLEESNAIQREHGADIALLDPAALKERFPWLATEALGGGLLGLSNEGWLDPYSLLQAFRRKARSLGVTLAHDEVVGVAREGERVTSVTLRDGGTVGVGTLVNTAGASGARAISEQLGVTIPIESRKRCTFVFECREDIGVPPLTITPAGVAFRPEGRQFLVSTIPPPERDPETFEHDIDHWIFDEIIWPALAQWVPAFEAIKVTSAWSCHYDHNTLDENLIIGGAPGLDNYLMAIGFSGHGLQQSPAVGRALSELIVHGAYRSLDLTRMGYQRVLDGVAIREADCW